jgi:hypothetical protein
LGDIEEFHKAFSAPVCLFLVAVPDNSVASSNVVSEEGKLDVHLVLVRASCVHAKVNNLDVLVADMIVGHFLDSVGVLVDSLVHFLRTGNQVLELTSNSELFLLLCPLYWVSLVLLLVLLFGLLLHN